jgi:hypothetical protein
MGCCKNVVNDNPIGVGNMATLRQQKTNGNYIAVFRDLKGA